MNRESNNEAGKPHLIWGWPVLDLQDDQTDHTERRRVMRTSRLTTQQQLFGVAPGGTVAEQVWVRNEGPMAFFGATRTSNTYRDDSVTGGCLLRVNTDEPYPLGGIGQAKAYRQVLDRYLQAWCVMPIADLEIRPQDSCITDEGFPLGTVGVTF